MHQSIKPNPIILLATKMVWFLSTTFQLIYCLAAAVAADGTFRSRPDLRPLHLNVTIECSGRCESGFIFVAPFAGDADVSEQRPPPLQSGAYIFTDSGELVWSGFTYFSGWTGNFQAARWKGRNVLFAFEGVHNGLRGHGHGHHAILDQHYRSIRQLRAGNHLLSDKHEFVILDEKSALFQVYHPMQINLTPSGGTSDQTWIVDARFQGRLRLCVLCLLSETNFTKKWISKRGLFYLNGAASITSPLMKALYLYH